MNNRIELWADWYFYNNVIYDKAGNSYTENDIKISWLAGELVSENFGNKNKIKIMREELQIRTRKALSLPIIALIWECPKNGIIEEIYDLTRGAFRQNVPLFR